MHLEAKLNIAHHLVEQAGKKLMDYFQKDHLSISEKEKNNPVTEADYAANAILVEGLLSAFPNDAILSEETSVHFDKKEMDNKRKTADFVWIIDPLDGTKEFIAGYPHFAVSLALWQKGKAVLGFIYNPAENFFLHGGSDFGIFFNGKPFQRPKREISSMHDLHFCLSRSEIRKGLLDNITQNFTIQSENIVGSIAYKLGLLAYGRCDLILSLRPKNEWDFAAGSALLAVTNKKIVDLSFQEIPLNKENPLSQGLICGSPKTIALYQEFLSKNNGSFEKQ